MKCQVFAAICVIGLIVTSPVEARHRIRNHEKHRCHQSIQSTCQTPTPQPCMPQAQSVEVDSKTVTKHKGHYCTKGNCNQTSKSTVKQKVTVRSDGGAQRKAEIMASRHFCGHIGGDFGGGTHEGCGMSSTRESAIQNCCYWGQLTPIEIGVAQAPNGLWYACVFYQ